MRRALLVALAAAAAALATAATSALAAAGSRAADANECRGLQVCVPVRGPWVVVPAAFGSTAPAVEYQLSCPLAGYVVGGTDARVSDILTDVSVRGETGSPVSPGVTTLHDAVFIARYAGVAATATTFRPFIGCVPAGGGGGPSHVSYTAPPSRPLTRVVTEARVRPGASTTVRVSCPATAHLVGGAHAVAFRSEAQPGQALLRAVSATQRTDADTVTVTARARASIPGGARIEVQVEAICAPGGAFQ